MSELLRTIRAALQASGKAVLPGFGTFQVLGQQVNFEVDRDFRRAIATGKPPKGLPDGLPAFGPPDARQMRWSVRVDGLGSFTVNRLTIPDLRGGTLPHAQIVFRAAEGLVQAGSGPVHLDAPGLVAHIRDALLQDETLAAPGLGTFHSNTYIEVAFTPRLSSLRALRGGRPDADTADWLVPLVNVLATGADVVVDALGTFAWGEGGTLRFSADASLLEVVADARRWRGERVVLRRGVTQSGGPPRLRDDLAAVLSDPRFAAVRIVEVHGAEDGDAVALAGHAAQLVELHLVDGGLGDVGAAALAAATWPKLERVVVRGNVLSQEGIAVLRALPGLDAEPQDPTR